MSLGWTHYAVHRPEPHILLFRCDGYSMRFSSSLGWFCRRVKDFDDLPLEEKLKRIAVSDREVEQTNRDWKESWLRRTHRNQPSLHSILLL